MKNKSNKPPRFSPLTLRILAIIILPSTMFFFGVLHLDQYRTTIIQSETTALKKQGDAIARSIGLTDAQNTRRARRQIADVTLRQVEQLIGSIPNARIQVFQPDGTMIADTNDIKQFITQNLTVTPSDEMSPHKIGQWLRDRVTDFASLLSREDKYPIYHQQKNTNAKQFPIVLEALNGDENSVVMRDKKHRLIIGVAIPIRHLRVVRGALFVTASAEHIEENVQQVQFTFFQIFAGIIVLTMVLGSYLARSITRPITKLAAAANSVRTMQKQAINQPKVMARGDEIGILARSIADMTDELQKRMNDTASFAADVAHEIKNPLTSLRSAVETMRLYKDPKKQQELMKIILDDVARLDRLISDISTASRIDAAMSQDKFERIDLCLMMRNIAEARKLTINEKHPVEIKTNIPKKAIYGLIIESRFIQVIDNIYANALSFSPKGGSIEISVGQKAKEIIITIADEGSGIPEAKIDTIFDRFYSERPSGESFGQHSGLGLSIVRQIITAHGGRITAQNRNDKNKKDKNKTGAIFTIALPIA